MKAYVNVVQSREREIGCDVLTHQKVSLRSPPNDHADADSFCVRRVPLAVVWCRLRRQPPQDRHRRHFFDRRDVRGQHRGPVQVSASARCASIHSGSSPSVAFPPSPTPVSFLRDLTSTHELRVLYVSIITETAKYILLTLSGCLVMTWSSSRRCPVSQDPERVQCGRRRSEQRRIA